MNAQHDWPACEDISTRDCPLNHDHQNDHDVLDTISLDNTIRLIGPKEGDPFGWPNDEPHFRRWSATRARRN